MSVFSRLLIFISILLVSLRGTPPEECDEPEYFGICNPYVPGVILRPAQEGEPILVIDTWPHGPAEKAGLCPGDEIVAVNDLLVRPSTYERVLKEIISDQPSRVSLRIRRDDQEVEFFVARVRESTLTQLNEQKWLQKRGVPLQQTRQGLENVDEFVRGIQARYGFKEIEGVVCPVDIPDKRLQPFLKFLRGARKMGTRPALTALSLRRDGYSTGLRAIVVKDPQGAWVHSVIPNSPAHRSGLIPGDEVLEIDGQPVAHLSREQLELLLIGPGEPQVVKIKMRRENNELVVYLQTQKAFEFLPPDMEPIDLPHRRVWPETADGYLFGLSVFHASSPNQVIISELHYPSPAFTSGLLIGDSIVAINGVDVVNLSRDQLEKLLGPHEPTTLAIEVLRHDRKLKFEMACQKYVDAMARIGRRVTRRGAAVPQHCPDH